MVLNLFLFNIFISGWGKEIESALSNFVDDTNQGSVRELTDQKAVLPSCKTEQTSELSGEEPDEVQQEQV